MSQRKILQEFEEYRRARMQFVQSVANYASQKQTVDLLQNTDVISLLRPLLIDNVASIQYQAVVALGRLAGQKQEFAEIVAAEDIISQILSQFNEQNKMYKRVSVILMKYIAKHSLALAENVVNCGAPDVLVAALESFDTTLKEEAALTVGIISRQSEELSQALVDAGVVPLLVYCLQEPDKGLKRAAAGSLSDIAKHSSDLANCVVSAGAIAHLSRQLIESDIILKRHVYGAFASIAKHSIELAELVIEAEDFWVILSGLQIKDEIVQKHCATLIREFAKHTAELSQLVVNSGGLSAIIEYMKNSEGYVRLPGVLTLGYIAAHSEALAAAVIASEGVSALKVVLISEEKDDMKASAAWAIGQIARHTPEHANEVAKTDVLQYLLKYHLTPGITDELKSKTKKAIKHIVQKCVNLEYLDFLICHAPCYILKYALDQLSKILPHDSISRKKFVASGALKKIQEIRQTAEGILFEYITIINDCFPEEVVRYYSPGYEDILMERVESYQIPIHTDADES